MPARSAVAGLSLPIPLDLVPELLRHRGVEVTKKRLQKAAAGGVVPIRREGRRYVVDAADLAAVEAYFRAYPTGPYRQGAAALATAGRR
jgi:hypothetical protein